MSRKAKPTAMSFHQICETMRIYVKQGDVKSAVMNAILNPFGIEAFIKPNIGNSDDDEYVIDRVCLRSIDESTRYFMNGVIVSGEGIIARPPRRLKIIANHDFLDKLDLSKYELIEASNGTMLTVYNHAHSWYIGTSRSYNISNVVLGGERGVFDVFSELARNAGIKLDELLPHVSYTFIISHQAYHIMPKEAIYFVIAYDRNLQEFVDIPEFDHLKQLNVSAEYATTDKLKELAKTASSRFLQGDNHCVDGVVLRAKAVYGDTIRDYYLPSDITDFLKFALFKRYNLHQHDNRFRRIQCSLLLYLNAEKNADAVHGIFAQEYADDFASIERYLTTVEDHIIAYKERGEVRIPGGEFMALIRNIGKFNATIRDPRLTESHLKLIIALTA